MSKFNFNNCRSLSTLLFTFRRFSSGVENRVLVNNWCGRKEPLSFPRPPPPTVRRSGCVFARSRRFVHSVAVSVGRERLLRPQRSSKNSCSRFYCLQQQVKMPERKPFERLPAAVKPLHYTLSLEPDLKSLTFNGEVSIQIEVVKEVNEIVLNAIELEISKTSLRGDSIQESPKKIEFKPENETAHLHFESKITPGTYNLDLVFSGEINDKMKGLYRSKYTDEKGEEQYAAVTQFEATDARRCFPCWDEPALKATFDISLKVPKKLVALSNMSVKDSKEIGDLIQYHFERTPIMSTYLVAVVIGEYDYVEGKSSDGVLVRVYTPRGKKEQGIFALEVATKVLPYYKEYFNIAYPLPKIDLIAIADFSAGAMENWGLVTYRETCLLVDSKNTSAIRKQWIALVVGHELAHQWFGNLVTMEWWTHLWLNEGYASFVEFLCVNHLFPEYDIWTQFVSETYIKALELDCLKNSHPIEVPVGHPSEIDEIFDDISYNKGAAVIRMLHHYIGDEDFRKGMNLYLTRHQYKNTFTEDLWAALEEASNKPVRDVMSSWTKQMGFPVVTVSTKPAPDGVILQLKQAKFTADGSQPPGDYKWMIPISVSTSQSPGNEVMSMVLESTEEEILVPGVGPKDWIKINPGTIGFYRTKYTPEMLEKLIPAIKNQTLPPLDRLGLLDDLFAMVQAGHTSTVEVLKLLQAFEDETNYTVWSSISNILSKLNVLISHTKCEEAFVKYEKKLLSKLYQKLGWNPHPNEPHLNTVLRGLLLVRLALLDDNDMLKEAKRRFDAHFKEEESIPADLRSACYKAVLRLGGAEEYERLLTLYKKEELHEEKDRIIRSLGSAKDVNLLSKLLALALTDAVKSQDTVFVIIAVAMNNKGRDLAYEFFKEHWSELKDRYSGGFLLTRVVKYCTENFASEEKAREVEAFFRENKAPGAERTVQQAVESIRLNASWLQRDADAITKYLSNF